MATHSSVLAWRIPGTGKPGGLPSMGSHRVRHDWSDLAIAIRNLRLNAIKIISFYVSGATIASMNFNCSRDLNLFSIIGLWENERNNDVSFNYSKGL